MMTRMYVTNIKLALIINKSVAQSCMGSLIKATNAFHTLNIRFNGKRNPTVDIYRLLIRFH